MKIKFKNRTVVTKCNIELELENEREMLAMKNICAFAEKECYKKIYGPDQFDEELNIIKQILNAINE